MSAASFCWGRSSSCLEAMPSGSLVSVSYFGNNSLFSASALKRRLPELVSIKLLSFCCVSMLKGLLGGFRLCLRRFWPRKDNISTVSSSFRTSGEEPLPFFISAIASLKVSRDFPSFFVRRSMANEWTNFD